MVVEEGNPGESSEVVAADSAGKLVWLRVGQHLLRVGGIGIVKIQRLQEHTSLTTGSFYHHFSGMPDFLAQLAGLWGEDNPVRVAECEDPDPIQRLRNFSAMVPRDDMRRIDMAMRDWAGSNPTAAEAVTRVDDYLLTWIAKAFTDLGFDETGAQVRSQAWIAFGTARVRPPWPKTEALLERLLGLLTRPD